MNNLKDMKRCGKCKVVRFKKNFYKDRSKRDFLRTICKECDCKKYHEYYKENASLIVSKSKARYYRKKESKNESSL